MESRPDEWWRSRAATLLGYFQHHGELQGGRWCTNERIARQFIELLERTEPDTADLLAFQEMLRTRDVRDGTGWDEFRRLAAYWLDQSFQSRSPDVLDARANGYRATTDAGFLADVRDWVSASGDLLVLTLHHAEPGDRGLRLLTTFEAFEAFVAGLRPRTGLLVFRDRQLPIRGCVDDEFTSRVLGSIPDGAAWLVVPLMPTLVAGDFQLFHHGEGTTAEELRSELLGRRGKDVAVGLDPQKSGAAVASAVVPDTDGRTLLGIY